ncbi:kinase-like domain-containing protein [Lophiotrema nucula]|uniref:Kinase-like domain-containing protein n=1 Tax=Lophiotrema nucula TaxID=690887 RepID=A0A6A5Z1J4_9PLEO|nr:kinase-like domain-containing protein [Lophiotrema nucula]
MPKDDANEVANFLYWVIAGSSDKLDTSSTDVAGIAYCLTHLGFEILSVENFATTLNTGTSCRLIYSVAPYLLGGDSREENRWHIALSSTRFPTPVTSTYETACTSIQQTFHTAYTQSDRSQSVLRNPSYFYKDSEHTKLLQSKNIIPSDHRLEQDWSGGGQHVEFSKQEKQVINDILIAQGFLGSSSSAIVESVKCRRILLARKTIRCGRGFSKSQAVDEVAHLNRLDHSHIVRVIGTYVVDNDLSILMFPAAEYNLNSFLEKLHDPHLLCETDWNSIVSSSATFFCCLSGAMSYIHGKLTKHMDIKPANILVRDCWGSSAPRRVRYKVYIADFGIARSYVDIEAVETDGPTLFTRKFAAPEVVDRQKRGLAADVFSLGCVFVEILAALTTPIDLTCYGQLRVVQECQLAKGDERKTILQNLLSQNENGDTSYQANIEVIQDYVSTLSVSNAEVKHYGEITGKMLSRDPTKRPTAKDVAPDRMLHQCCIKGSDPLDAAPKEQSPNEESVES